MLQGTRMPSRGMPHRFMGPGFSGMPPMRTRHMQPGLFGQRSMVPQAPFNPMMGRGTRSTRGGGLLAKLLGKGGRGNSAMPGFLPSAGAARETGSGGGAILKTLTDPAALNGFLNNTQNVLKAAQQFGPMIQQYGPLVRNLPSMWKLYKGLKDLPDADEQTDLPESKAKDSSRKANQKKASAESTSNVAAPRRKSTGGVSSPKLFI